MTKYFDRNDFIYAKYINSSAIESRSRVSILRSMDDCFSQIVCISHSHLSFSLFSFYSTTSEASPMYGIVRLSFLFVHFISLRFLSPFVLFVHHIHLHRAKFLLKSDCFLPYILWESSFHVVQSNKIQMDIFHSLFYFIHVFCFKDLPKNLAFAEILPFSFHILFLPFLEEFYTEFFFYDVSMFYLHMNVLTYIYVNAKYRRIYII